MSPSRGCDPGTGKRLRRARSVGQERPLAKLVRVGIPAPRRPPPAGQMPSGQQALQPARSARHPVEHAHRRTAPSAITRHFRDGLRGVHQRKHAHLQCRRLEQPGGKVEVGRHAKNLNSHRDLPTLRAPPGSTTARMLAMPGLALSGIAGRVEQRFGRRLGPGVQLGSDQGDGSDGLAAIGYISRWIQRKSEKVDPAAQHLKREARPGRAGSQVVQADAARALIPVVTRADFGPDCREFADRDGAVVGDDEGPIGNRSRGVASLQGVWEAPAGC